MREGKRFKLWWLFIVAPFGLAFTALIISIIHVTSSLHILDPLGFSSENNFAVFIYGIGTLISTFILYYFVTKRGIAWKEIGFKEGITIKGIAYTFIALILTVALTWLNTQLLNLLDIDMTGEAERAGLYDPENISSIIYAFIGAVILAPVTEEIIFRGYVYQMFDERYRRSLALVLSALVFSLIHIPFFGIGNLPFTFLWAFIALYLFIKFKNLYLPILLHAIVNFIFFIS